MYLKSYMFIRNKCTCTTDTTGKSEIVRHTILLYCLHFWMPHLSTPVASPCRAVCHWTGRNSTLLMACSSSGFLKWLCSSFSDTLRKSSTESARILTVYFMYNITIESALILACIAQYSPHSTMLLNLRSHTGPIPWTMNTRWSTLASSPGKGCVGF